MSVQTPNEFALDVQMEHDGNYWVVKCPAFGMVAANVDPTSAWIRALRMITGQMLYAFGQDPSLTSLFRKGFEDQRADLLRLKAKPFKLVICEKTVGTKADVPMLATCA